MNDETRRVGVYTVTVHERRRVVGGEEGASWDGAREGGVYKDRQISHATTELRVRSTSVDLSATNRHFPSL